MTLPTNLHTAATGVLLVLLLMLTGCATGYKLKNKDGVETLYHIGESGTKQIVYVVYTDGRLQIHNENDPLVKRIYANYSAGSGLQEYTGSSSADDDTRHQQILAARMIQMGRLQVAEKRHKTDPIFVTIRAAEAGAFEDDSQVRERNKAVVMEELARDNTITITPESGDIDIFFKSYVRETAAVNLQSKKLVTVSAYYFEALVRSNYLPQESYTICELGHLMDRQAVIQRTAQRVNKVIKEKIGPNIPKDRARFLPSSPRGV